MEMNLVKKFDKSPFQPFSIRFFEDFLFDLCQTHAFGVFAYSAFEICMVYHKNAFFFIFATSSRSIFLITLLRGNRWSVRQQIVDFQGWQRPRSQRNAIQISYFPAQISVCFSTFFMYKWFLDVPNKIQKPDERTEKCD